MVPEKGAKVGLSDPAPGRISAAGNLLRLITPVWRFTCSTAKSKQYVIFSQLLRHIYRRRDSGNLHIPPGQVSTQGITTAQSVKRSSLRPCSMLMIISQFMR